MIPKNRPPYRAHPVRPGSRPGNARRAPEPPGEPRPPAHFRTSLLNRVTRMPFEPGSFNAAIAACGDDPRDGFAMVYRPDEYRFRGVSLDGQLSPRAYGDIPLHNVSDPRLFWANTGEDGERCLWMSYSLTEVDQPKRPISIWCCDIDKPDRPGTPLRVSPPGEQFQKNWMPFTCEGRLYFIESVYPHKVHEYDLGTGRIVATFETNWRHPWFLKNQQLRGNTNAVRLDDGNYLATFHTAQPSGPNRCRYYDNGCYVFEGKPPFRVLRCANRTYLKAEDACEPHFRKAGQIVICFPCGMARFGHELYISYGDNDSSVKVMQVTVQEMLATTIEVYL